MIANHKGEIPFVILILPFLLGIACGLNFIGLVDSSILVILLIIFSFVFILLNVGYKRFNIYKNRWLGGVLISLILFVFGWISVANHNELNRPDHFSKTPSQFLIVRINNEPVFKNGLLRFTGVVEQTVNKNQKKATSGTLLINLKDSLAKTLYYGDEILIPSNYSLVEPPYNPAEFNYKQYLANQNIFYQSFLYGHKYVVLAHDAGNPVIAYSLRLRQRLVDKLKLNIHNPDAIAIASTMILGYRADLSSDVLQAYSKTGTVYVLTVSGSQIAIIYLSMSFIFSFLSRHKYGKILRAIIIIGVLGYYALLTGLSPAVCRAAIVISIIIMGKTYNRYINSLNILAVSAFGLLLYDPFYITEVGSQLAYLAVAGLIVLRPITYKWFQFKNSLLDKLWAVCSVSIAAQIIVFPLSAYYFHQFPVYFLVSNVLVIIPATIIMYAGIAYLLLPQIKAVSNCLGYILEKTILLMNKTLAAIEQFPLSIINKIWLNTMEYLLLYVLIISLFYFLYDKKVWTLRLALSCALLFSISFSYKNITAQTTNSIAFLNLRKYTGIVMRDGDKAVVVSDLSDTDKNYRYAIQPYLDSCRINNVSIYNLKQDINTTFVLKRANLIQFRDKRIMIFDKTVSRYALDNKLKADYVYVNGNPYVNISNININYDYHTLLVSASNSDRFISFMQQQIKTTLVNYKVLKRNKALLVVSN